MARASIKGAGGWDTHGCVPPRKGAGVASRSTGLVSRAAPLATVVFATAAIALAGATTSLAAARFADQVVERALDNGFRMLLLEDHKAPVAVVQVWYRVGSRDELPGKTGLSHLLEHMMFKGTQKHGPEDYSRIIARNGGNENAFTSDDATVYFATLASDRIDVELELEADRMRGLKLDDTQFQPELKVVMEERRLRTDNNPIASMFESLNATTFVAHPYRIPTVGWASDLAGLELADLKEHYDRYYQPNNAFLVAVGDFDSKALGEKIAALFSAMPASQPPPPVRAVEPEQQGPRRVVVEKPARLPYVALQYHTPNLKSADSVPLDVLQGILSAGKSSRLYRDLVRQRRLALEADADYDRTARDDKLFSLSAQPQPGVPFEKLEQALLEQIAAIQKAPPSPDELKRAKAQIEASFIFAQDSMFYRGLLLGTHEIAGGWRQIDDYLPAIAAVKTEDVQRVAKRYLDRRNQTTGVLRPLAGAPPPNQEQVPSGMVH